MPDEKPPATGEPPWAAGEKILHDPVCRCGHKKGLHAGHDADGRCVKRSCGCGKYEAAAQVPTATGAQDEFGGHEFAYESHTDLFRCTRCRTYEVVARKDGTITQCPGDVPGEPMVLNAY